MDAQSTGRSLEQAGGRVREAASQVAQRGWGDVQQLLKWEPLGAFGIHVTVGGVVAAVLAILAAVVLSALLRRALRRYGDRHVNANRAALYTVSRLLHYVLLAVGLLVGFSLTGIPLDKFGLFAGAIGVGLGFGLQAVFSNFISGLILLFDQSLKVGDFVELEGDIRGTVRAINIRATRITTNDNIDVLVPNSEFVNKRVVNWTHGSFNRRIRVPFRVSFEADKELVKKAALDAAGRVPFTLATTGEQRPQVWLVGYGENGIDFLLVVWLTEAAARRNVAIQAAFLWELDTSLKAHGIEVPRPQRELRVMDGSGRLPGPAAKPVRADSTGSLRPHEREQLSDNDATQDTRRRIAEEADMRARDEAQARAGEPGADHNPGDSRAP